MRQPHEKTTSKENKLIIRQPHEKTTSKEDKLTRSPPDKKTNSKVLLLVMRGGGRGSRRKKYDILFEQSLINHKAVKCGTSSWRYMKLPKVLHRIYFLNILYNVFECFIARCLFYFLKKVIFVLLALS